MSGTAAPAQAKQSPAQINLINRNLILRGIPGVIPPALDMWQQINTFSLPASPAPGSVLTIPLRNVGLVKRLLIEFKATVTAGASSTQTLTAMGLANFVSQIVFSDLGNNQRINTTGWHLTYLSGMKRRGTFGAAYTSDTPLGTGNINTRIMFASSSILANGTSEIDFWLEVPFVQNDEDLQGAIFADVNQASMQVVLTLNPNMFLASGSDATLGMYQSAGSDLATLSALSMTVYQNYLDRLPRDPKTLVPYLPAIDLGTGYMLNNVSSGLPVVNQDNGQPYINARQYLSTMFYYDNAGTLNINGSDITYIALTSANLLNALYLDGKIPSFWNRTRMKGDLPKGMYYLDHRHNPIDTNVSGNWQLTIRPSSVGGSSAYFGYAYEAYAIIGLVNQGGSLPTGG